MQILVIIIIAFVIKIIIINTFTIFSKQSVLKIRTLIHIFLRVHNGDKVLQAFSILFPVITPHDCFYLLKLLIFTYLYTWE